MHIDLARAQVDRMMVEDPVMIALLAALIEAGTAGWQIEAMLERAAEKMAACCDTRH